MLILFVKKRKHFLNSVALEFSQVKKEKKKRLLNFIIFSPSSAEVGSWFLFEHGHFERVIFRETFYIAPPPSQTTNIKAEETDIPNGDD